jgi:hypothetical protein
MGRGTNSDRELGKRIIGEIESRKTSVPNITVTARIVTKIYEGKTLNNKLDKDF